ncbi:hypothetical protein [Streptomyces nigrescens]
MTTPPHPNYPPGFQMPAPTELICRCCGISPAAAVTFRTQVAYVVALSIRSSPGPFCYTCGVAMFRRLTTEALAKGWWSGFSLFATNWYVLAANLRAYRKIKKLPPGPLLPWPPLPPGKPIHRRPAAYIALVPLLWALLALVGMTLEILGHN